MDQKLKCPECEYKFSFKGALLNHHQSVNIAMFRVRLSGDLEESPFWTSGIRLYDINICISNNSDAYTGITNYNVLYIMLVLMVPLLIIRHFDVQSVNISQGGKVAL